MARIAGVDIPREKRVVISLTYVYGIGLKTSQKILKEAGVSEDGNRMLQRNSSPSWTSSKRAKH